MDLPALACTSNLHEPHQNKNHSLNIQNLIGIVDVLAFQEVICVRKTNIELFSRLMRRMQWNDVRRKLFLISQMLFVL